MDTKFYVENPKMGGKNHGGGWPKSTMIIIQNTITIIPLNQTPTVTDQTPPTNLVQITK